MVQFGQDQAAGECHPGHAQDISGEDLVWIGNLRVGVDQRLQADTEVLGDGEHRVTRLDCIPLLEAGRAANGNAGMHWLTGDAQDISGEDLVGVGDLGIGVDQRLQADAEALGDQEHGVAAYYCIPALEARRAANRNAGMHRLTGDAEDIAGEDFVGVGDVGIGVDQRLQADAEALGDQEHGVAAYYCIPALETGRTAGRDTAAIGRRSSGNAEDVAGDNLVGVRDVGVGVDQGLQADAEALGNQEHGVALLHRIPPLEPRRAVSRYARLGGEPPVRSLHPAEVVLDH